MSPPTTCRRRITTAGRLPLDRPRLPAPAGPPPPARSRRRRRRRPATVDRLLLAATRLPGLSRLALAGSLHGPDPAGPPPPARRHRPAAAGSPPPARSRRPSPAAVRQDRLLPQAAGSLVAWRSARPGRIEARPGPSGPPARSRVAGPPPSAAIEARPGSRRRPAATAGSAHGSRPGLARRSHDAVLEAGRPPRLSRRHYMMLLPRYIFCRAALFFLAF